MAIIESNSHGILILFLDLEEGHRANQFSVTSSRYSFR